MSNRNLARFLAACFLALLASCGGGGGGYASANGGGTPNASPGGIWNGTESVSGLQVEGIVDESGQAHFIRSDGVQYIGTVTTSGNSFTAQIGGYTPLGTAFPDGSTQGTGTVTGTIDQRVSITATTSFTTEKGSVSSGTLNMTFNQLYDQASSLAAIAATYTTSTGATITVDATGAISGQDPNTGCVVGGTVSVIDASYNAYAVTIDYRTCTGASAVLNGVRFTGLATLDSTSNPVEVIAGVSGNNGSVTYAIVYALSQ